MPFVTMFGILAILVFIAGIIGLAVFWKDRKLKDKDGKTAAKYKIALGLCVLGAVISLILTTFTLRKKDEKRVWKHAINPADVDLVKL